MANDVQVKRQWWKHWWGVIIIVLLVLLGVALGYYLWSVFKFYGQIQRGELSTADYAFLDKFTTSDRLRQQFANTPVADVEVATTDDPQFGASATAPLVIVEFADFGCPWSREESFIIRELASKYADKISFIYRDFPLDELHPQARLAAEASECAQDQGGFWAFHDTLYQNQDRLSRDDLIQYATEVGLDVSAFTACLDSGTYRAEVEQDYQAGLAAGVRGTPTFFLNGRRVEGAIPRDVFEAILRAVVGS